MIAAGTAAKGAAVAEALRTAGAAAAGGDAAGAAVARQVTRQVAQDERRRLMRVARKVAASSRPLAEVALRSSRIGQVDERDCRSEVAFVTFGEAVNAVTPDLDELTRKLDALMEGPRDSPRAKHMRELAQQLEAAKKGRDPQELRRVADGINEVAKSAQQPFAGQELATWPEVRKVASSKEELPQGN